MQRKEALDSLDYQALRKQTRYLLRIGLGAVALGVVAGFIIGSLRVGKLSAGLLGGSIFAGIFAVLWFIVLFFHLLTYLSRKTVIEGTVLKKIEFHTSKGGNTYLLQFEGKQYNVPRAFYDQVQEGRQVKMHFSNSLFLFIRGEVLENNASYI